MWSPNDDAFDRSNSIIIANMRHMRHMREAAYTPMVSESRSNKTTATGPRRWYRSVGPGLITACVVIGPGSILTSSKVGAQHGFAMYWVVALAVVFMMFFMTLGARLGVVARQSPGELISARAGRPLAVLIGVGVFFISAAYQFGNNLGIHSAFQMFVDFDYTIVIFNGIAIAFLFSFRNLYRAVERLMMCFVGLMLASFTLTLIFAQPSIAEMLAGFVPPLGDLFRNVTSSEPLAGAGLDISLLGLVATTLVITAAYNQAYLVQQKGWGKEELSDGLLDARVGSVIMALITLMIMGTAAANLRGQQLENVDQVAAQLTLFGAWGKWLFCLGLFSAAYSSFLVNSMIGGFILSDGLGLGSRPTDLAPKIFTTVVLLTGMVVALYVIKTEQPPVALIVAAQAATVLAAPLVAGALIWLTNRRDIMGPERNSLGTNLAAGIGFLLLLALAGYTASEKVWPAISRWWSAT